MVDLQLIRCVCQAVTTKFVLCQQINLSLTISDAVFVCEQAKIDWPAPPPPPHTHTHVYCIQYNIIQTNKTSYNNLNTGLNLATILTGFLPFVMHFCFALLWVLLYFLFCFDHFFASLPFRFFFLLGLCSKPGGTEVSQVGLASHVPWRLLHAGVLSNRVSLEFHISWIIHYSYKLICILSKDMELQSVSQIFSTSKMGMTSVDI